MCSFVLNGYRWYVRFVGQNSKMLIDRTGCRRLATTDPVSMTVYLSDQLYGEQLLRVLIHEIGHCAIWSFHLVKDIHMAVDPAYWIDAEEWLCNVFADYGQKIFDAARTVMGFEAWRMIPESIQTTIKRR